MLTKRFVVSMISLVMIVAGMGVALGQNYPSKPIRIVTSEVGATNDFAARLVGQGVSARLGQPMIVENRPSIIIPEIVAKATPDGYTLLLAGNVFWTVPLLQKVSYDPVKDFAPVTLLTREPFVLVVVPSLPAKTVRELIDFTKTKPGELNYATGASGGAIHLAMELFKTMAGVNIVQVAYKSAGQALNAVVGGQVQLMIIALGPTTSHTKAGRLRALAVTSAQPSALAPGLPTLSASGLPGFDSASLVGMFAPAKTPVMTINKLNQEIVRFLNAPEVKENFLNAGVEVDGSSPEKLMMTVKSDVVKWGRVIKDAGIHVD